LLFFPCLTGRGFRGLDGGFRFHQRFFGQLQLFAAFRNPVVAAHLKIDDFQSAPGILRLRQKTVGTLTAFGDRAFQLAPLSARPGFGRSQVREARFKVADDLACLCNLLAGSLRALLHEFVFLQQFSALFGETLQNLVVFGGHRLFAANVVGQLHKAPFQILKALLHPAFLGIQFVARNHEPLQGRGCLCGLVPQLGKLVRRDRLHAGTFSLQRGRLVDLLLRF